MTKDRYLVLLSGVENNYLAVLKGGDLRQIADRVFALNNRERPRRELIHRFEAYIMPNESVAHIPEDGDLDLSAFERDEVRVYYESFLDEGVILEYQRAESPNLLDLVTRVAQEEEESEEERIARILYEARDALNGWTGAMPVFMLAYLRRILDEAEEA